MFMVWWGCLTPYIVMTFSVNLKYLKLPGFKNDRKILVRSFVNTAPAGLNKTNYELFTFMVLVGVPYSKYSQDILG